MLDIQVTPEVADAIAEIGRNAIPRTASPAYASPEGVLFRKALALIEREEDWCQHSETRLTIEGKLKYCSVGALNAVAEGDDNLNAYWALSHVTGNMPMKFNDTHTHAEVIAKWHEAGHANGWL